VVWTRNSQNSDISTIKKRDIIPCTPFSRR